jgi:hypothetical protein
MAQTTFETLRAALLLITTILPAIGLAQPPCPRKTGPNLGRRGGSAEIGGHFAHASAHDRELSIRRLDDCLQSTDARESCYDRARKT